MSNASKRERQRLNREDREEYQRTLDRRQRLLRIGRVAVPLVVIVVAAAVVFGGGGDDERSAAAQAGCRDVKKVPASTAKTYPAAPAFTIDTTKTYTAVVDTSCGSFTIQLDPKQAPQTVNSFAFLANEGFYNGLPFHRVVKDFVIQGGDPKGDGSGGPGYTLPDEPPATGYLEGSVAMANKGAGTTGSQFYVVTSAKAAEALNAPLTPSGKFSYSILGQVVDGIDTVRKINKLGSTSQDLTKQAPKAIVLIHDIAIQQT